MTPYQPCVHMDEGLCAECQADYDEDPSAWDEYGNHPVGLANWRALQDEIAAEAERVRSLPPMQDDPSIPY